MILIKVANIKISLCFHNSNLLSHVSWYHLLHESASHKSSSQSHQYSAWQQLQLPSLSPLYLFTCHLDYSLAISCPITPPAPAVRHSSSCRTFTNALRAFPHFQEATAAATARITSSLIAINALQPLHRDTHTHTHTREQWQIPTTSHLCLVGVSCYMDVDQTQAQPQPQPQHEPEPEHGPACGWADG